MIDLPAPPPDPRRLVYLGHPAAGGRTACGRCTPPATTSRSWCPQPIGAAVGARRRHAVTGEGRRGRAGAGGDRGSRRRCSGPTRTWASSSPTDGSSSPTCWRRCRWSTCTSRCCRAGAVRHRWNGPSSPATRSPGVCLMVVEEGLDTGGVYASRSTPVGDKSLESLRAELVDDGIALLARRPRTRASANPAAGGRAHLRAQDRPVGAPTRLATGCRRRRAHVRIGDAWTTFRDQRLKVLTAYRRRRGGGRCRASIVGLDVRAATARRSALVGGAARGQAADVGRRPGATARNRRRRAVLSDVSERPRCRGATRRDRDARPDRARSRPT